MTGETSKFPKNLSWRKLERWLLAKKTRCRPWHCTGTSRQKQVFHGTAAEPSHNSATAHVSIVAVFTHLKFQVRCLFHEGLQSLYLNINLLCIQLFLCVCCCQLLHLLIKQRIYLNPYLYLSLSLAICPCTHQSSNVPICPAIQVHICPLLLYPSIYLSDQLSTDCRFHQSLLFISHCRAAYVSIYLSMYLFVYLSMQVPIYLPVYLSAQMLKY